MIFQSAFRPFVHLCVLAAAQLIVASIGMANADDDRKPGNPRRRLPEAECREIARLSAILVDKRGDQTDRAEAARKLGRTDAHIYTMPALLAVLRDRKDAPVVRINALDSLTRVEDRSVIDELIELSTDEDHNVAYQANIRLANRTGGKIGSMELADRDPRNAKRVATYKKWKAWWNENRTTAVLDWDADSIP